MLKNENDIGHNAMTNITKLFTCLLMLSAGTVHAGLEWSFGATSVNGGGANTASAIIKVTPDDVQLAAADEIGGIANLSINLSVGLFGDIAGQQASIIVTPLVDPGLGSYTLSLGSFVNPSPPGLVFGSGPPENGNLKASLSGVQNGSNFGLTFLNTNDPSFADLFATETMLDVFRLDIELPDGFEKDVDVSDITLTIDEGNFPVNTQFGEIGSPDTDDPLFAADFTNTDGLTTTLSVVPEPSSMAYLGLCLVSVTGVRWYRRRKQA